MQIWVGNVCDGDVFAIEQAMLDMLRECQFTGVSVSVTRDNALPHNPDRQVRMTIVACPDELSNRIETITASAVQVVKNRIGRCSQVLLTVATADSKVV